MFSKHSQIGTKKVKQSNSQKELFIEIWEEREHVSELSGKYLGDEMNAWFFAHILSKGSNPQLKYNKENIMLVTQEEHWQLDQNTHLAKQDPLYKPFFDKAEELKTKFMILSILNKPR